MITRFFHGGHVAIFNFQIINELLQLLVKNHTGVAALTTHAFIKMKKGEHADLQRWLTKVRVLGG